MKQAASREIGINAMVTNHWHAVDPKGVEVVGLLLALGTGTDAARRGNRLALVPGGAGYGRLCRRSSFRASVASFLFTAVRLHFSGS